MPVDVAEETALARASIYRLLAVAFSYPTSGVSETMEAALAYAQAGAEVIGDDVAACVDRMAGACAGLDDADVEGHYQRSFTLSYSEDCPMYETAFSAKHLFQQTRQLADLAGFYRAFGVAPSDNRPDHIAMELEFGYLLAVKEAVARAAGENDHVETCREAERAFLRDHLARWAPLFAGRTEVAAAGTVFADAAALLRSFVASEVDFLAVGDVDLYRNEPAPPDFEPGDMSCPLAEETTASLEGLFERGEDGDGATH